MTSDIVFLNLGLNLGLFLLSKLAASSFHQIDIVVVGKKVISADGLVKSCRHHQRQGIYSWTTLA